MKSNITTWPELGINFWGINKNASSSFRTHFMATVHNDNSIITKSNDRELFDSANRTMDRLITPTTAHNNQLINICIVRSPYSRFKSIYKYFQNPLCSLQKKAIQHSNLSKQMNIDDFIDSLAIELIAGTVNKHACPQHYFIDSITKIDHVVKLEQLETTWPISSSLLPTYTVNQNKMNIILNNKQKNLINHLYKDDFKIFKY